MVENYVRVSQRQSVRDILLRAQANNQAGVRVMRERNKRVSGVPFTGLEKATVWLNAAIIPGKDISLWRQDRCGAHMYWRDYGNTKSEWGWEVDHVIPVSLGGTDIVHNLQALQWRNNRRKGDNVGTNYCAVRSRA
jgi:hypothetical protein